MRIVFATQRLGGGGAQKAIVAFANALVELGEEVHIVCLFDTETDYALDERVSKHLLHASSDVRVPKVRTLFKYMVPTMQLLNLSGDVIILFGLSLDFCIWLKLATLFSKTKILYAVRNNDDERFISKEEKRKWRLVYRQADGIWIQTEGQRKFFPKFVQKKIFQVSNILNSRFLDIQRTNREKISNFINVGRIHPQKNQKMLIKAFERMIKRTGNQDATLTIYGRTPDTNRSHKTEIELKTLISQYHLENRVFLLGYVSDIETKYEEADAFILSSDYEGCPNALMEAMASGLPCISTDCPTGPSTFIENGKNGLLVPVGDEEAMSQAMEYMMKNPQLANQMGIAAKHKMKEWRSAEQIAGQLLTHLKKLYN